MEQVFLSRRNLLTLLNKLDRRVAGEDTKGCVIKNDDQHPKYPQTMRSIAVFAIEDDEYYAHREPGYVLPVDEPKNKS